MLCQKCQKRVANVQMTQIVNNNKSVVYLCEQCAREEGKFNVMSPFSISDFFSGIMGFPYMASAPQQNQDVVCETCGMSYEEFKKIGKLGCSNCYKVYGDKLVPLLRRLHGNIQYNGKFPSRAFGSIRISREIEKLKEQLNIAIKNEEYEKAAVLRDQIKSLESNNM
ncbi:MAG TPA: UvrB/UvrC motif-containing protein [Acetivibrio sp.]|uniref:UvrB/UvrC motif-containing protein n=1 Tax=Acetivibrio sp. TaxID=1872092 RepID=UPI002B92620F|nr:UvrB/UvrC motif-containing protein [Acetivibrio sp.]HOM01504.1 UvrB/UvrC motif-containing protein [Acetivibrio sp.]